MPKGPAVKKYEARSFASDNGDLLWRLYDVEAQAELPIVFATQSQANETIAAMTKRAERTRSW